MGESNYSSQLNWSQRISNWVFKKLFKADVPFMKGAVKAAGSGKSFKVTPKDNKGFSVLIGTPSAANSEVKSNAKYNALVAYSNPWVAACVNLIARSVASAKPMIINKEGQTVPDHPLLNSFRGSDRFSSFSSVMFLSVVYLYLMGDVGWYIQRFGTNGVIDQQFGGGKNGSGSGKTLGTASGSTGNGVIMPTGYYPMRGDKIRYEYKRGMLSNYIYTGPDGDVDFDPSEILMFMMCPDPANQVRGLAPVNSVWSSVVASDLMRNTTINYVAGGSMPPYVVVFANDMREEDAEEILYNLAVKAKENPGEVTSLPPGTSIVELPQQHDKLMYSEQQKDVGREIATGLGVPHDLIDLVTGSGGVSGKEASAAFFTRSTVKHVTKIFDDTISDLLLPICGSAGEKFVLQVYDPYDDALKMDQMEKQLRQGWITKDEARSTQNLPPIGGYASELTFPVGQIPMSMLQEYLKSQTAGAQNANANQSKGTNSATKQTGKPTKSKSVTPTKSSVAKNKTTKVLKKGSSVAEDIEDNTDGFYNTDDGDHYIDTSDTYVPEVSERMLAPEIMKQLLENYLNIHERKIRNNVKREFKKGLPDDYDELMKLISTEKDDHIELFDHVEAVSAAALREQAYQAHERALGLIMAIFAGSDESDISVDKINDKIANVFRKEVRDDENTRN